MSVKQTKKLSEETATTTVAAGEKFAKVDAHGNVTLIDLADLKAALLDGINLDAMLDGVFIMYHQKSDNCPLMAKPHKWPSLQTSGEIADGVVVVEGGKVLVVAPTEADSAGLLWTSANMNGSAPLSNRVAAINDWNGKANTESTISKSTSSAITNTAAYAPGFCYLYSRTNANGQGLTASKWWLPSVGEMLMIYANMQKINYCLSLITGASQISESAYWTSTERNNQLAWSLFCHNGNLTFGTKDSAKSRVRPVSAFIG